MNSRERVTRALEFKQPDRLPRDVWVLPAARMEYGERLSELIESYDADIASLCGPFDHAFTKEYYEPGKFTDPWGSVWTNIQAGMIGEVKEPVFEDYAAMEGYINPAEQFWQEFQQNMPNLQRQIDANRAKGKFIIGGWISLFERMQYLRGTEDLYCDIALEEPEVMQMADIVMVFMHRYLDAWLAMDIDAVAFGDDWGTQISLLISPDAWVKIFKPMYKQLIDRIKAAGKKVFFHSDGHIYPLYPQFIELGVDAINSQLWCMDIEQIAANYAGKITFWGEISRQTTLPSGTPRDVSESAEKMKRLLCVNGGGLIGQSEINKDVPLENVEAFFQSWN